jgi:hypothetical protein
MLFNVSLASDGGDATSASEISLSKNVFEKHSEYY